MKKAWFWLFSLFLLFFVVVQTSSAQDSISKRYIIKYKANSSSVDKDEVRRNFKVFVHQRIDKLNAESVDLADHSAFGLLRLRFNPKVEYVEEDFQAAKTDIPNDPSFSQEWGLSKINAVGAWNVTHGVNSVNVAIVDTGINGSHPDLSGKVSKRANFTNIGDADGDGHGTHVAGIVAAATNNSVGVAGTGFDTDLMSVKVLDDTGSGYYSWISNGIIWAADNGAKVINLSLGGSSPSTTLQNAVNYAASKGVVVVAAAGNSNSSGAFYPAFYSQVIAVAATDQNDTKAYFSNYGSWVDIASPGVSIYSTYKSDYALLSGTSMAAPFVSGVAGLEFAIHPGWSRDQVINKVLGSTDQIAKTGVYWANGRLNACKALDCNLASPSLSPVPSVTPTSNVSPSPSVTPVPTSSPSPSPSPVATATSVPTAAPSPTPVASPKPWYCVYIPDFYLCK